jgi:hypothetical protein
MSQVYFLLQCHKYISCYNVTSIFPVSADGMGAVIKEFEGKVYSGNPVLSPIISCVAVCVREANLATTISIALPGVVDVALMLAKPRLGKGNNTVHCTAVCTQMCSRLPV